MTLHKNFTMTQQEIFQNMTKGEWTGVEFDSKRRPVQRAHNKAAAAIAVNATYGKGINPESVEKWQNLLTRMYVAIGDSDNYQNGRIDTDLVLEFANEIKEALTAAKL